MNNAVRNYNLWLKWRAMPGDRREFGDTEVADVQGVCGVELGGFEPPTSWVRSK
jgi:hypothetical protein